MVATSHITGGELLMVDFRVSVLRQSSQDSLQIRLHILGVNGLEFK